MSPKPTKAQDFLSLTKPRLSSLVVLTTGSGLALAPGHLDFLNLVAVLLGACLVVGSANALNCILERDVDALMKRTADRPMVKGRLTVQSALLFGAFLGVAGIFLLAKFGNALTAALGLFGILSYALVYTPMKRRSMGAVFAGAVPGAIPPMMGWTACTGHLDAGAWILFGILFCWQLPHFIAISLFHQTDYDRAGLKTLPGTLGRDTAQKHMIFYAAFLMVMTFVPFLSGHAGLLYLGTAAILGTAFSALCLAGFLGSMELNWSRIVFLGSLAYLPMVLGMWVVDHFLKDRIQL